MLGGLELCSGFFVNTMAATARAKVTVVAKDRVESSPLNAIRSPLLRSTKAEGDFVDST
jgi:hypothetical protein